MQNRIFSRFFFGIDSMMKFLPFLRQFLSNETIIMLHVRASLHSEQMRSKVAPVRVSMTLTICKNCRKFQDGWIMKTEWAIETTQKRNTHAPYIAANILMTKGENTPLSTICSHWLCVCEHLTSLRSTREHFLFGVYVRIGIKFSFPSFDRKQSSC